MFQQIEIPLHKPQCRFDTRSILFKTALKDVNSPHSVLLSGSSSDLKGNVKYWVNLCVKCILCSRGFGLLLLTHISRGELEVSKLEEDERSERVSRAEPSGGVVTVRGRDIGDLPTEYDVVGLTQNELPVIGGYSCMHCAPTVRPTQQSTLGTTCPRMSVQTIGSPKKNSAV